ncbi:MAG: histidinol-phosphate transaminase [Candidatus Neomarinimicrobiota bacterium]
MPLVPSYINKLHSYKPGKPIEEVKRELGLDNVIKLASNENPLGASPKAIKAIKESIININRYPDASGYELRKKLAKKYNLKINNVVLGSGSEGIMSTIMRTFLLNEDELISAKNSFIGFRVLANASGRKVHWVSMRQNRYDLDMMAKKISDYTKIIYIANPDNPMGTYITKKEFDEFYSYVPDRVLIILDEAYFEFANKIIDYPDSMTYRYDNVITLRSFSKAYGLGGLRIGYGFAHDKLIDSLMKVKVPFEPSSLAQIAGLAALDDDDFLSRTLELNKNGMNYLIKELKLLNIKQIPSIANFITTIWESETYASHIANSLLERGIIVRQLTAFGWADCIRISIGLKKENIRLIESLKEIL